MIRTKNLSHTVIALGTLLLVACGADKKDSMYGMAETDTQPLMGGWKSADITNPQVQKAAEVALRSQGKKSADSLKLISIESAQTQIVAGTNHKLTLQVKRGHRDALVEAVVWEKLDHTFELTTWSWKKP